MWLSMRSLAVMRLAISLLLPCIAALPIDFAVPSLLDATIYDLIQLLETGSTTSVALIEAYITRIGEVNDVLNAVIEINPDAGTLALAADMERIERKGDVGLLHGIPILIKDNIATKDKMNNTAGSVCMLGAKVSHESPIVGKLREAGAIILGKTNLNEWAGARVTYNTLTNGWSGYGGYCRAAFIEDQDPSGSSSGSAVAVSVGLAPAALGTETDGSIIGPSDKSNLVGIKPTMGLTSRDMVIPITHRQDTVGPITLSVADAALILTVIAGKDPNDNYTLTQPFEVPPDYTAALNLSSLRGARIGVPWNGLSMNAVDFWPEMTPKQAKYVLSAFYNAIKTIEDAGAIVVAANYSFLGLKEEEFWEQQHKNVSIMFQADFLKSVDDYLEALEVQPPSIYSFVDLINCTKSDPREEYPYHDIGGWEKYLNESENNDPSSARVWEAYQNGLRMSREGLIIGAMERANVDALLMPSLAAPDVAATIGAPIVTVPLSKMGDDAETTWDALHRNKLQAPGVPFGIAFVGRPWSDEKLIGYAYAFEQLTNYREKIKPLIVPKTELIARGSQVRVSYGDDL